MLQIGVRQGVTGAQSALDYLTPFLVGDLNVRSGWAIIPPPLPKPVVAAP